MDSLLRRVFRTKIDGLKGENFQSFIEYLFIIKFEEKFTCIKKKKDGGCDGILNGDTCLAVYAPIKYNINKFKRKIKTDYEDYTKNWQQDLPKWKFIFNGELTKDNIKFVNKITKQAEFMDINQILNQIDQMNWPNKRKIANYLNIDEDFFVNDILKEVIDDLLEKDSHDFSQNELKKKNPPYLPDKVNKNFSKMDVQGILDEFDNNVPYRNRLKDVLIPYEDSEIRKIKCIILTEYNSLGGNFKTRLNNLANLFSERNRKDTLYVFYVRIVLLYFFEICLIGEQVEDEK